MSKLYSLVFGFILVAGCATPEPPQLAQRSAPDVALSNYKLGADTALSLTARYRMTAEHCLTINDPAFNCSGIIFRGTEASTLFYSWNPSPASVASGGVSFSYLRTDSKYNSLAYNYNHGLIFYTPQDMPAGKESIEVLCSFPMDAGADVRDDKGCGQHSQYPVVSRPCQAQHIYTAEEWRRHFSSRGQQCGFDVRATLGEDSAKAFAATVRSMALSGNASFTVQNELRMATWDQNIGQKLPIQAFFYLSTGSGGLIGAQHDQRIFLKETGIWLPIIFMTLPATATGEATFRFKIEDQWEPEKPVPRVTKAIAVGQSPAFVAISPDSTRAYVTNRNGDSLSVIDTISQAVIHTITGLSDPIGVAVSPDGSRLYVVNYRGNTVSVFDTSDYSMRGVVTGFTSPYQVVISPNQNYGYVSNGNTTGASFMRFNTSNNTVDLRNGGFNRSIGISASKDGSRVYLAENNTGHLRIWNTHSESFKTHPSVLSNPEGVAPGPEGYIYVCNMNSNIVSVWSDEGHVLNITGFSQPRSIAFDSDGRYAYVTNASGNTLAMVDLASYRIIAQLIGFSNPLGIAVAPNGNFAYVVNRASNTVSVVSLR